MEGNGGSWLLWAKRSPNLTPSDNLALGFIKSLVFVEYHLTMLFNIKHSIRNAVHTITQQMQQRVFRETSHRLTQFRDTDEDHFEK